MRIATIALLAIICCVSCKPASDKLPEEKSSFNEAAEKEAILAAIEGETSSFYKRDYDAWKKYFIQKEYAFQGWNNGDGSFDASVGWANIDSRIGQYIQNNPVKQGETSHPKVERKNMAVHFFSDKLAYLVWDQYNSDSAMKKFTLSKDQRIMEKEDGQWKIVNVSAFWDYKTKIDADSLK